LLPAIESSSESETDNTGGKDEELEEVRNRNIYVNINSEIKDDTGINNKLTLRRMNI